MAKRHFATCMGNPPKIRKLGERHSTEQDRPTLRHVGNSYDVIRTRFDPPRPSRHVTLSWEASPKRDHGDRGADTEMTTAARTGPARLIPVPEPRSPWLAGIPGSSSREPRGVVASSVEALDESREAPWIHLAPPRRKGPRREGSYRNSCIPIGIAAFL